MNGAAPLLSLFKAQAHNYLSNSSFSDISNRFLKSSIKGGRRAKIKEKQFLADRAAWGILWQFSFELLAACGYKANIKHLGTVKEKEKNATERSRSTVG